MEFDIVLEDARWENIDLEMLCQNAGQAIVTHLSVPLGAEVAILACDDARIAVLNDEFREKNKPTNVLSWPSEDLSADNPGEAPLAAKDPELGDIAISYDTCIREAEDQGKPVGAHVTHLIVHATLHLLGYDHIHDKDADLMERLEVEILAKLGISNPYIP